MTVNLFQETEDVLKLRNYSRKTIKSYLFYINDFLFFAKRSGLLNKDEAIKRFLLNRQASGQSPQTINLALNAIKFFYREVIKSPDKIDLKFAKINKRLPEVLSPPPEDCSAHSRFCAGWPLLGMRFRMSLFPGLPSR